MTSVNPLRIILTNALAGCLLYQRFDILGLDLNDYTDGESSEVMEAVRYLTREVGLNFELTATELLIFLYTLFSEDKVRDHHAETIAKVIWAELGDPHGNGAKPPTVYVEAAKHAYDSIIFLLKPTYSGTESC
jgi:hypothetical protein